MNAKTERALAEFVCDVLADSKDEYGCYHSRPRVTPKTPDSGLIAANYIGCKNVAGRFFDEMRKKLRDPGIKLGFDPESDKQRLLLSALSDFPAAAFDNTPQAMLELAVAIGFEPPSEDAG